MYLEIQNLLFDLYKGFNGFYSYRVDVIIFVPYL